MKPKQNYTTEQGKASPIDCCQTPYYAVKPLLEYLNPSQRIWESACGTDQLIATYLNDQGFNNLTISDIQLDVSLNFFEYEPDNWDIMITNPPYSLKFKWIERAYKLGKPFALLLPVETIGAMKAQNLLSKYGYEAMYLDSHVDFRMVNKGWGGSAQFPVFWLCNGILPEKTMYASIKEEKRKFKEELRRQGLLDAPDTSQEPIDNIIDRLNIVTGLKYSYYNIKKEKAYWLKRMNGANSNESIDYKYKSLDDLYDSLKKTLDDATLLKELTNG